MYYTCYNALIHKLIVLITLQSPSLSSPRCVRNAEHILLIPTDRERKRDSHPHLDEQDTVEGGISIYPLLPSEHEVHETTSTSSIISGPQCLGPHTSIQLPPEYYSIHSPNITSRNPLYMDRPSTEPTGPHVQKSVIPAEDDEQEPIIDVEPTDPHVQTPIILTEDDKQEPTIDDEPSDSSAPCSHTSAEFIDNKFLKLKRQLNEMTDRKDRYRNERNIYREMATKLISIIEQQKARVKYKRAGYCQRIKMLKHLSRKLGKETEDLLCENVRLHEAHVKAINNVGSGVQPISDETLASRITGMQKEVSKYFRWTFRGKTIVNHKAAMVHLSSQILTTECLHEMSVGNGLELAFWSFMLARLNPSSLWIPGVDPDKSSQLFEWESMIREAGSCS